MRILLVDDHAIVRRGLQQILSDEYENLVFGEAENAGDALDQVIRSEWDVVVLDISMPGRSGLDVLKEIKRERPKLPILVLSIHPEDQFATRVLKAGAAGYMTKESAPEELMTAITKVIAGGKYVSPTLAELLAEDLEKDTTGMAPHRKLSDREYEVLRMLASGSTVTEIADELALSVKTISTYRARILEKINMRSNADLTRYAIKNGIIE